MKSILGRCSITTTTTTTTTCNHHRLTTRTTRRFIQNEWRRRRTTPSSVPITNSGGGKQRSVGGGGAEATMSDEDDDHETTTTPFDTNNNNNNKKNDIPDGPSSSHHHRPTTLVHVNRLARTPRVFYNQRLHELSSSSVENGELLSTSSSDAIQQAEAILNEMKHLAKLEEEKKKLATTTTTTNNKNGYQPDLRTYTSMIMVYCNHSFKTPGIKSGGQRAEELLYEMMENGIQPDRVAYTSVMNAWSRDETKQGAIKCLEILQRMKQQQQQNHTILAQEPITHHAYTTTISAFGRIGMAREAELILQQMLQDPTVEPNLLAFHAVLLAHARSASVQGAQRAELILARLESISSSKKSSSSLAKLRPTNVTYHLVLDAWARSGNSCAGERVETLVNDMKLSGRMEPDVFTFNTLLTAWYRSGRPEEAVSRAEYYFEELLLNNNNNNKIRPNGRSYSAMMTVWKLSGIKPDCFFQTMKYFELKHQQKQEKGDESCKLSLIDFMIVLDALESCEFYLPSNAIMKYATNIMNLLRMEFDLLNNNNKKKKNLLFDVEQRQRQDEKNDIDNNNKQEQRRQQQHDDHQTQQHQQQHYHHHLDPNHLRGVYSIYLRILSRSNWINKAQVSWDILKEMDSFHIPVHLPDLNAILGACAWSPTNNNNKNATGELEQINVIFEIACNVLERIHQQQQGDKSLFQPDERTYERFFLTVELVGKNRGGLVTDHHLQQLIQQAWEECQRYGFHQKLAVSGAYKRATTSTTATTTTTTTTANTINSRDT